MNSYLAALEAAFPIERILYCKGCGFRLNDLGLPKPPDHCPICGILNRDASGESDKVIENFSDTERGTDE